MTGFRELGRETTLPQLLDQRRNDAATVDYLLSKVNRDRTGLRTVPTDELETKAGDTVGDVVYDIAGLKRYEFINNSGTLQWVRWTIEATF